MGRLCPQPGFVPGDCSLAADVVAEPAGLLVGGRGQQGAGTGPHSCQVAEPRLPDTTLGPLRDSALFRADSAMDLRWGTQAFDLCCWWP